MDKCDRGGIVPEVSVLCEESSEILYGRKDHLTAYETIAAFAMDQGAGLTLMDNGERRFIMKEQPGFLDNRVLQGKR